MATMRRRERWVSVGAAAVLGVGLVAVVAVDHSHGHGHGDSAVATGPHTSAAHASTAPSTPLPVRAGERVVTMGVPGGTYTPSAPSGGTDDYHCFLVDPAITQDAFITGVRFQPGNAAVVHHAIFFRVAPDQVAAAERLDAQSSGKGWNCFGGPGLPSDANPVAALDSAPWLSAWAPGSGNQLFPDDVGVPLPAGSRVVMQVHYNLLAGKGPDSSKVELRLAPGDAGLTPLRTTLLVAPVELPCAATESGNLCNRSNAVLDVVKRFGAIGGQQVAGLQLLCGGDFLNPRPGPTQSCDRRVRQPMTIRAAAGHMHLLGRSIKIELNPGKPDARTLLDIPVWNFDDQGSKPLPQPVQVRPGDVLRVTCTHDAALRGMTPSLQSLPPRYVVWGEGTSDEMCLGVLSVT